MKAIRSFFAVLAATALLGADPKTPPGDKVFLYWDINSSLGLPGGPTPSQVTAGTPPVSWSKNEIECIKNVVRARSSEFKKRNALYMASAIGGEAEGLHETGYKLSTAQAQLSWTAGKAAATVAHLEQSVKFADNWVGCVSTRYATDGRASDPLGLSEVSNAAETRERAKIAVDRVRAALTKLGYDLSDVAKQPRTELPKRD